VGIGWDKRMGPLARASYLLDLTGAGEGIRTLDPNLGKVEWVTFWSILQYPTALSSD
jgi:hypothetical protein